MLKRSVQSTISPHLAGQAWQSVIQMNYDIVKADGGELKVETKEGEKSDFFIKLF